MSFVGPLILAPGLSTMLVSGTVAARFPFTGQADSIGTIIGSEIRNDLAVQIVDLFVFSAAASGFISIMGNDGVSVLFRVAHPAVTSQMRVPFGAAGIVVPLGFSAKASATSTVFTVGYRRLAGERIL